MLNVSDTGKNKKHENDGILVNDEQNPNAFGQDSSDASREDLSNDELNAASVQDPETTISTHAINDCEFRLSVSVAGSKLQEALRNSWQNFSDRLISEGKNANWQRAHSKYRGFRNVGKIPYDLVAGDFKSRFNVPLVDAVAYNVHEQSVEYVLASFLKSKKLSAEDIEYRSVERFDWKLSDSDVNSETVDDNNVFMKYDLYVEVSPKLKSVDLKSLKLDAYNVLVTEDDAREDLKKWAKSNNRGKSCEPRAAKNGDIVEADLTVNAPGGAVNKNGFLIELGSPLFVPDFQKQFLGKSAGDFVTYKFDVPQGVGGREFEGKTINTSAVVRRVMDAVPYEFDNELAHALKYADLEDAIEKRREMLEQRGAEMAFFVVSHQIEEGLSAQQKVPVSEKRYNATCKAIWSQIFSVDWDCDAAQFEAQFKQSKDKMQQRVRDFVTRQLTVEALVKKFRRDEAVTLGERDVQEAQTRFIEGWYSQRSKVLEMMGQTPQDIFNIIGNDPNLRMRINQDALRNKVLRRLFKRYKEVAQPKAIDITFEDLDKKCTETQKKIASYFAFEDQKDEKAANKRTLESSDESTATDKEVGAKPAKKQKVSDKSEKK